MAALAEAEAEAEAKTLHCKFIPSSEPTMIQRGWHRKHAKWKDIHLVTATSRGIVGQGTKPDQPRLLAIMMSILHHHLHARQRVALKCVHQNVEHFMTEFSRASEAVSPRLLSLFTKFSFCDCNTNKTPARDAAKDIFVKFWQPIFFTCCFFVFVK